jgi:hypothetical protein
MLKRPPLKANRKARAVKMIGVAWVSVWPIP